jgi:hypothetical protein
MVTAGDLRIAASVQPPCAMHSSAVSGAAAMLLDRFEDVRAVSGKLPYVAGF